MLRNTELKAKMFQEHTGNRVSSWCSTIMCVRGFRSKICLDEHLHLLEILQKATYKPHGFKLICGTVCSAQAFVMLVLGHHHAMNFFLKFGSVVECA